MGELEGRLVNMAEGLVFALLVTGLFWLFSLLVRIVFKKRIGSPRYYIIAIVSGFLLHRALIATLSPDAPAGTNHSGEMRVASPPAQHSLDAPFIPPAEKDVESFPAQLDAATAQLPPEERIQLTEAVAFLVFSIGANLAEQDPAQFDHTQKSDLAARSLTRLYRYAQEHVSSMTLRKYVELAEEIKRQKPQWWAAFRSVQSSGQPAPNH